MSEQLKRDWLIVLAGAAVLAWLFLRRKQARSASPDVQQPNASVEIPNASTTPDYLSYNLPAFQKPSLLLPSALQASAASGGDGLVSGGRSGSVSELRLPSVSAVSNPASASGTGGCCCESRCGDTRGGNLVASQDQLLSQFPSDLAGKMAANLLSAFPHGTVSYEQ